MPHSDATGRALRMLGLATRAGRTVIGVPLICTALSRAAKGKIPLLVLMASDSSDNTKKRLCDRTAFYGVPLYTLPLTCAQLAHAVGKKEALVAAVGVTEENMAANIRAALEEHQ